MLLRLIHLADRKQRERQLEPRGRLQVQPRRVDDQRGEHLDRIFITAVVGEHLPELELGPSTALLHLAVQVKVVVRDSPELLHSRIDRPILLIQASKIEARLQSVLRLRVHVDALPEGIARAVHQVVLQVLLPELQRRRLDRRRAGIVGDQLVQLADSQTGLADDEQSPG
jgi:hypothetical protein